MAADADTLVGKGAVDGTTAAAILLMLLPEEAAAEIVRDLDPGQLRTISHKMFAVSAADEPTVEAALDLFIARCRDMSALSVGATPRIRAVITQAVGNVRADNILSEVAPATSAAALDLLRWMEVPAIAAILQAEHPQVGALILAVLTPEVAAETLGGIGEEQQADLLARAARLRSVSREAIEDLEAILARQQSPAGSTPPVKLGGKGEAARIVNKMRKSDGQRVLKSIKKADKLLGQQIEDEMFVFDNLAELDAKSMGAVLRGVEAATLTLALKGADPALVERMLGCMSARAADSIRDEMSESGPTKRADVDDAQKQVVLAARRLADEGTIMLGGGDADYV